MFNKTISVVWISTFLISCGGDDGGGDEATYENFLKIVKSQTDNTAIDCGTVTYGGSQYESNLCMADAFTNDQQFYAFYELLSYDSTRYVSPVLTKSGDLKFYYYNSGTITSGSITDETCVNAEFTGSVDSSWQEVFECDI
ncbi:hypothetical protein P886_3739 [Alteromonadaceae bacterium 2753L.S.0a.02]|nr:hypothetical protein P886_3739 [Alteromonadaceae bacterium 2753L.S.0a.02]